MTFRCLLQNIHWDFSVWFSAYEHSHILFSCTNIVNFNSNEKKCQRFPLQTQKLQRSVFFPHRIDSPSTQWCAQVRKPSVRWFHSVQLCLAIIPTEQCSNTLYEAHSTVSCLSTMFKHSSDSSFSQHLFQSFRCFA